MKSYYECYRCKEYQTDRKTSMVTHFQKKKRCERTIDSISISDDILLEKSLEKIYVSVVNDTNINERECEYCRKIFSSKYNKKKHFAICKVKRKNNLNDIFNSSSPHVLPFHQEWNLNHINIFQKHILFLSENRFTELLKKILENDINLNVFMENQQNIGYIFDEKNGYIKMDKSEIVRISMEKLFILFQKTYEELKSYYENIDKETEMMNIITVKYQEYCDNKIIQRLVNKYICDIYIENKDRFIHPSSKD